MAITRYTYANPWRELDRLSDRLSQMFEGASDYPMPSSSGMWVPAVSVEETENELILTAELPGMKSDDVDIQIENNVLTIRGEKREERKEEDENRRFHVWERSYGSFQRSFTLPRMVKFDEIAADFEEGLLRIRVPKSLESRGRRIQIGGGQVRSGIEETGSRRVTSGEEQTDGSERLGAKREKTGSEKK